MTWVQRTVGTLSNVNWTEALGKKCLDPYLVWFEILGYPSWIQCNRAPDSLLPSIPILIELKEPHSKETSPDASIPAVPELHHEN